MRAIKKPMSPLAFWRLASFEKNCAVNSEYIPNPTIKMINEKTIGKSLKRGDVLPNWDRLCLHEKAAITHMALNSLGTVYVFTINLNKRKMERLLSEDKAVCDRECKNLKDQLRISFKKIGETNPLFWFKVENGKREKIEPHIHGAFVLTAKRLIDDEQKIKVLKKQWRWALPNKGQYAPKGVPRWIEIKPQDRDKKHNHAGWGTYATKQDEVSSRKMALNRNRNDFYLSNGLLKHAKSRRLSLNNTLEKIWQSSSTKSLH